MLKLNHFVLLLVIRVSLLTRCPQISAAVSTNFLASSVDIWTSAQQTDPTSYQLTSICSLTVGSKKSPPGNVDTELIFGPAQQIRRLANLVTNPVLNLVVPVTSTQILVSMMLGDQLESIQSCLMILLPQFMAEKIVKVVLQFL